MVERLPLVAGFLVPANKDNGDSMKIFSDKFLRLYTVLSFLLIIVLLCLNIFLYRQSQKHIQALGDEVSSLQSESNPLQLDIDEINRNVRDLASQQGEAQKSLDSIERQLP